MACSGGGSTQPVSAGDVAALQFVRADGETLRAVRDDFRDAGLYENDGDASAGQVPFDAAAVSLGCLGVVSSVTLEVVPAYDVHQRVLTNVAVPPLLADDGKLLAKLLTEHQSCSFFIDFSRNEARGPPAQNGSRLLAAAPQLASPAPFGGRCPLPGLLAAPRRRVVWSRAARSQRLEGCCQEARA